MTKKTQTAASVKADDNSARTLFAHSIKTCSGYEDIEAEIIATVAVVFRDLLLANWPQIKKVRSNAEDSAVSMSFGFEVDTSGKQPLVKGKLAFSEKFTDSAEAWVDDPEQVKLALSN